MKKIHDLQNYVYNLISDNKILVVLSSFSDFLIYAYVFAAMTSKLLALEENTFLAIPFVYYILIFLAFAAKKQVALTILFITSSIMDLYDIFAILASGLGAYSPYFALLSSFANAIIAIVFLSMIDYKKTST